MSRNEPEGTDPGRLGVRDIDRIREKVSLSLEPRQLGLIGLGVVVVMAAVFTLGVMVGDREDEALQPAGSHEIAGAPVSGSFPAEPPVISPRASPATGIAARKTRIIRRAAIFPTPAPDPLTDPRDADEGPLPLSSRRDTVEMPARIFEAEGPWPSVAVTDLAMCMSCIYEDRGGCVPTPLPPVAREAEPEVPKPVAKKKVATKPLPAKKAPAKKKLAKKRTSTSKPVAAPYFSVQVRAYRESDKAKEFVEALELKGYRPYMVGYTDPGGNKWFRVRIGRFATAAGAQEFAAGFNRKEAAEAIPVALETK